METCSVLLTFESVTEILWCDYSNCGEMLTHKPGKKLYKVDSKSLPLH